MKGRKVGIQCHFEAGTKCMYKFPKPVTVTVIEHMREENTDMLFAKIDKKLIYFTPSCIIDFKTQKTKTPNS